MAGFNLPPGVSLRDIDPPDQPCECCGAIDLDRCICPECPLCRTQGDPRCYRDGVLHYSPAQLAGQAALQATVERQVEEEQAYYDQLMAEGSLTT